MIPLSPPQNKADLAVLLTSALAKSVNPDGNMMMSSHQTSVDQVSFTDIFDDSVRTAVQSDSNLVDMEEPLPPEQPDQDVLLAETPMRPQTVTTKTVALPDEVPATADKLPRTSPEPDPEVFSGNPVVQKVTKQDGRLPDMDHLFWVGSADRLSDVRMAEQGRSGSIDLSSRPNQVEVTIPGTTKQPVTIYPKPPTTNFVPDHPEVKGRPSENKTNSPHPVLEVLASVSPKPSLLMADSNIGEARSQRLETPIILPEKADGIVAKPDPVLKNDSPIVPKTQFGDAARFLPRVSDSETPKNHPALKIENQWTSHSPPATMPIPSRSPDRIMNMQTWSTSNEPSDLRGHDPMSIALREGPSVTQPASPTQTMRHEMPPTIARQVADVIAQAPSRPVEIALSPMELGNVRLAINISDGGITVNLTAERPETLDLFRRHIDQLGQDLQALGYRDIAFSFAQGGQDQGTDEDVKQFQVSDAGIEEEITPKAGAQINLRQGQSSGLDLRL